MKTSKLVRGIELRYLLTMQLFIHGSATVAELVDALAAQGFGVAGRASKSVSDALRWEMGYGRVRRFGRGLYGPGWMPRSTEYRIHKRVLALRTETGNLSLRGGHSCISLFPGACEASGGREAPGACEAPRDA